MNGLCDNCEYPAKLMEYSGKTVEPEGPLAFCEVCYRTYLHRAVVYPRQYGDQRPLWASIGYIANMILDELRSSGLNNKTNAES